jgi:hypothetical protein
MEIYNMKRKKEICESSIRRGNEKLGMGFVAQGWMIMNDYKASEVG